MVYIDDIGDFFPTARKCVREEKRYDFFRHGYRVIKPKVGAPRKCYPPDIPNLCLLERL